MTTTGELAFSGQGLPVEVPRSSYYDFTSRITGHDYRIFVAIPPADPPAEGFPALYLLDGNYAFPTAVAVASGLALGGDIRPAVIVGIGYQTVEPAALGAMRFNDLATQATADWIGGLLGHAPDGIPGLTIETICSVDQFLRVIEEEIKPAIAALARVDSGNQTLMGHSLGGLTVIRALFAAPDAFRSFAAGSPSIWWGDRGVLATEPAFAEAVQAGRAQPRVLIAAGGEEQTVTAAAIRFYGTEANAQEILRFVRMVDNASELGHRLEVIPGGPGYAVRTVMFAEEGHMSVIPAFISRGVRFALGFDACAATPPLGDSAKA